MNLRLNIYSSIIFVIWFTSSCKNDKAKMALPAVTCNTPAVVSFKNDLQPLFGQYCTTAGCHTGNSPQGNLNLEPSVAYAMLMNKSKGYVDTVNPGYSLLYAQMTSASQPMPPTGNLKQCQLDLVMKWIQQKAKNN